MDDIGFPVLEISSSDLIDFAEFAALGDISTLEIAQGLMLKEEIKVVNSLLDAINIANKYMREPEEEFYELNLELRYRDFDLFLIKHDEFVKNSFPHRVCKVLEKRYAKACLRLCSIDYWGDPLISKNRKNQILQEHLESRAAILTGNPKHLTEVKSKIWSGRDRMWALRSGRTFSTLILAFCNQALRDDFSEKKYKSWEIEFEDDNKTLASLSTPQNFGLVITIKQISEIERLLKLVSSANDDSIRSKVKTIRKAAASDRPLSSYINRYAAKHGFLKSELSSICQDISRYNNEVERKRALRLETEKTQ